MFLLHTRGPHDCQSHQMRTLTAQGAQRRGGDARRLFLGPLIRGARTLFAVLLHMRREHWKTPKKGE